MRESGVSLDASSVRPTAPDLAEGAKAYRRRLPDVRNAVVHHFSVGGQEGYLTVGLYEDGVPGEIFIRMAKEGSTVSGLMDCFATAVSLALQFGVPLSVLCREVQPHTVRAQRMVRSEGNRLREVLNGLHLPLARYQVLAEGRNGGRRPERGG